MIDQAAQLAIGTAVTLLVQVTKTILPPESASKLAPYLNLCYSLLATGLWLASQPTLPGRSDLWPLFTGWLLIFATAAGVYETSKLSTKRGVGR